jgi:hypothetical protein
MMESEAWDSMKPADVTAFLEFCEGKLIDFEDAAARGELGAAKKAATLRRMLGDPAGRRFLAEGAAYLETLAKAGVAWGGHDSETHRPRAVDAGAVQRLAASRRIGRRGFFSVFAPRGGAFGGG